MYRKNDLCDSPASWVNIYGKNLRLFYSLFTEEFIMFLFWLFNNIDNIYCQSLQVSSRRVQKKWEWIWLDIQHDNTCQILFKTFFIFIINPNGCYRLYLEMNINVINWFAYIIINLSLVIAIMTFAWIFISVTCLFASFCQSCRDIESHSAFDKVDSL